MLGPNEEILLDHLGNVRKKFCGNDWEVRHASMHCYQNFEEVDLLQPICAFSVKAINMKEIMLLQPLSTYPS